ncbi:site-specific integrase [Aquamicrobium sp.]|uniref:tyrosine-type recombinase/integrase n=1 Tax=Aquamicrobium sp. TaxID=1872579 RepID=UPI002584283F|nr:site-specific integrase [Aquamicrobium sp.]MCK9549764.1 integrase arm-type DNA-binding domain-containing protein [Aquamicrobium sp.]
MANQRLTKKVVDAAETPTKNDAFIWDTELKGFGLRITPRGVKSYVLQYRMKGQPARRMTLGGHGNPWTAETARKEAERRLIKIKQGIDPVEEERQKVEHEKRRIAEEERKQREAEALAFDTYADLFVELYLKASWKDTWKSGEGVLKAVKPHFQKALPEITRSDVVELLDGYSDRPGMKKLVHSVLRKLFNWAVDRGDLDRSPIDRMKAPKTPPARKRVLSPEEVVALWHACADLGDLWRPFIRLLICTLQRREEVAGLDWSEIDFDTAMWQLPLERAKNDHPHRVPLNALALVELRSLGEKARGLVFTTTGKTPVSGFSKAKKKLDELMLKKLRDRAEQRGEDPEEIMLAPWRLHDLRRTGATNLQALGVPVEVTEAILNHISGTTSGIAGVYNLYKYEDEKRRALLTWSEQLTRLVSKNDGARNVVPFVRYAPIVAVQASDSGFRNLPFAEGAS